MKVTINDELSIEWVELGEGVWGDYNPDNPLDMELLRFDISISNDAADRNDVYTEPTDDGWGAPQDGSYCTQVGVTTPEPIKLMLLAQMAVIAYQGMLDGNLKRTAEWLSWVERDTVEVLVRAHARRARDRTEGER